MSRKILIVNCTLDSATGTVTYVKDLAIQLQAMGCVVGVYTPMLGKIGKEIQEAGIEVVNDLFKLSFIPDIIHGHHSVETVQALQKFSNTPAIFFSHGMRWHDKPPLANRILRYIGVSLRKKKFFSELGVPKEKVLILQ